MKDDKSEGYPREIGRIKNFKPLVSGSLKIMLNLKNAIKYRIRDLGLVTLKFRRLREDYIKLYKAYIKFLTEKLE